MADDQVLVHGPAGPVRDACLRLPAAVAAGNETRSALAGLVVVLPGDDSEQPADEIGDAWDVTVAGTLTGTFTVVQAAAVRMIEQGHGSIVIVGPIEAVGGVAGRVHTCAAAAGVIGFVQAAAVEWGRHGVRINAVVASPSDPSDELRPTLLDRTPMAALVETAAVADAVGHLLSARSAHVTGTVLIVDGGLHSGLITRWNGADFASNALLERGVYAPPADAVR